MQISSVLYSSNANTNFYQNKINNTENNFKDVVAINRSKETSPSNKVSEGVLPVEAYAYPAWYSNYLSNEMVDTPKINYEYWDLIDKLRKDNHISDQDLMSIQDFRQNDPIYQERLAKDEYRRRFKDELYEYGTLLDKYFHEALRENGVIEGSHTDYYEKVILDKVTSEKIHQSMQERVEGNPRFLELMEILGV